MVLVRARRTTAMARWETSDLTLDRAGRPSLAEARAEQIERAIRAGFVDPGSRLPSWRDLAAQLGVSRGTVRAAYDRLTDELLIVASGAAGTHAAETAA